MVKTKGIDNLTTQEFITHMKKKFSDEFKVVGTGRYDKK
ncbi:MAG: hypothetical protein CM15mP58_22070 [Burkholderiaceae bacterium]|nr:MAG: hypothetical protein CM15mP58_22070 [Burkholderiaceae bacterium]